MKKNNATIIRLLLFFLVCFLLFIRVSDSFFPKANTADFRGIVDEVVVDWENNSVVIYATYPGSDAKAEIKATSKIQCVYLDGRNFPINSLKKGDMIDLDYKGKWGLDGNGVMQAEAKWITVYPMNQASE